MIKREYVIKEVFPKTDLVAFRDVVTLQDTIFDGTLLYLPDRGYWWLAYHGEELAAFAGMGPTKGFSKAIGILVRGGVVKKHVGNGLQRKLIEARIAKGKELRLRTLYSTTYQNPYSANNLIACGFRQYEPSRTFAGPDTTYWKLPLTGVS